MAAKQFYHDIDLVSVGQILNARLHNVDNAAETTLAGSLTAAEAGFAVYNTDVDAIKTWDGTQFVQVGAAIAGDVIFYGVVTDLTATGNPSTQEAGAQYIAGAAGTLAWTGITFSPSADVEIGDVILYTSTTTAYIMQRNDSIATETVAGNIILATQAEVNAGTVTDEAITPATLAGWASNFQFAKTFFQASLALPNNTATTVNHALGLSDPNAFVVNVMEAGTNTQISVDVDSTDGNNLTLTARPSVTVDVTVIGY